MHELWEYKFIFADSLIFALVVKWGYFNTRKEILQ